MRRRRERGQAIVETALALTVFLTFVMGIMDLGRAAYTYNGLSNLAREASHYALQEYTNDSSSPCYWNSFDNAGCVAAVKSYITGLKMAPGLSSSNLSVTLTVECGGGTPCNPGIPLSVSLSSPFTAVSASLIGVGPFAIKGSSTTQFVLPPSPTPIPTVGGPTATPGPTSTPLPTPTVVPQGPPTNVSVSAASGCSSGCETFNVSWTPPNNLAALGHYDISFGSSGSYLYGDPVPAELGGSPVTNTTVDTGSTTDAICFHISAVFADGSSYTGTGTWHDGSSGTPTC